MTRLRLALLTAALLVAPAIAHAQGNLQASGIWVHNNTKECAWMTVHTSGKQVKSEHWPGWVAPMDSAVYYIEHRGSGQTFTVRAEFAKPVSAKQCGAGTKVEGDISKDVSQGLAYQVWLKGSPGSYSMLRY